MQQPTVMHTFHLSHANILWHAAISLVGRRLEHFREEIRNFVILKFRATTSEIFS